jgi:hypothetical protein
VFDTQHIPTGMRSTSRAALIASELFIGIAAVGGGLALLAGMMDLWLPIVWLAGSPFADYRLPALALILLIGGSNLAAAILLLARRPAGALASIAGGAFLIGFEVVEAATLGLRMWLQPFCFVLGLVVFALALRLWVDRPTNADHTRDRV